MTFTTRIAAIAVAAGLGSALLTAAPASAAARCDGTQVRTCVNMWSNGGYYFEPRATITDVAGDGRDYRVAVTNVYIQEKRGDQWERWGEVTVDADGFHDVQDVGRPGVSSYCQYAGAGDRSITIRARAYFKWDNFSTITGEWATSPAITVPCWG